MTAVEPNVLVRLLVADDPAQLAIAQSLFTSSESVWIGKTVLLETAWVLRSLYGLGDGAVCAALTKLIGLPGVQVEDEAVITAAFVLVGKGLELADAIHLASRPDGAVFVSFDKSFVKRAVRAGVPLVRHAASAR